LSDIVDEPGLARGRHQLFDGLENIVPAALGRRHGDVLGQNLVDERRTVRAHPVGQRVDLAHHII